MKTQNEKDMLNIHLTKLEADVLVSTIYTSFKEKVYRETHLKHYIRCLEKVLKEYIEPVTFIDLNTDMLYLNIGPNSDFMIYNANDVINVFNKSKGSIITINIFAQEFKTNTVYALSDILTYFKLDADVNEIYETLDKVLKTDKNYCTTIIAQNIMFKLLESINTYQTLQYILKEDSEA